MSEGCGRWVRGMALAALVAAMAVRGGVVLAAADSGSPTAAARDVLAKDYAAAVQAYLDGQYERAQGLFEGLLAAGWRNGPLYFNLGNTYLQRDSLGEAIRAYRRAELFMPRDSDLRHNLALARGQVAEPVGAKGPLYALRSIAFWYDLATHRELALATVAAWVVVCAMVAWNVASRSLASGVAAAVGLGLLGLVGGSWAVKHYELTRVDAQVVVNGDADARGGPSAGQAVAFTASEGTEVTVLASEGAYRRVHRADGREGWIRTDQLAPVRLGDDD